MLTHRPADTTPVAIVGSIVRLSLSVRTSVCRQLGLVPGVTTFEVEDADRIGVLIEAESLDAAHRTLVDDVESTPGVLAAWPVALEVYRGDEQPVDFREIER